MGIAQLHHARFLAIAARRWVGGDTVGNVPERHVLVRNGTGLVVALISWQTKRNESCPVHDSRCCLNLFVLLSALCPCVGNAEHFFVILQVVLGTAGVTLFFRCGSTAHVQASLPTSFPPFYPLSPLLSMSVPHYPYRDIIFLYMVGISTIGIPPLPLPAK